MVTVSEIKDATVRAGFDFARRLVDADFRQFLKGNGWRSAEHIIVTVDDEPVIDVTNRAQLHDTGRRAFIAIADPSLRFGFDLLIASRVRVRDLLFRPVERIVLGPGASIGMLRDALHPCGRFVPSDWTKELRFEKIAATAATSVAA